MKTNEFISALNVAPGNQLMFVDGNGRAVPGGYHLTELKAASFDTVDCGGQRDRWEETIVQLWVPDDADGDHMRVAKFLSIFNRVRGMIALNPNAEIRIEYGDENFFPSTYHVHSVIEDGGLTRVLLEPPKTTCKARDRRVADEELSSRDNACCTVAESRSPCHSERSETSLHCC